MATPPKWLPSDVPIADPQTGGRIPNAWLLFFQSLLMQASNGGSVTHTGTLTSGRLIKGNGGADITVGDLTGDVTTSGSLATTLAASGVTAATYGDSTHVARITFDAKGRATAASNVAIAGAGSATRAITFAIDGGGVALTTGIKADVYVPYPATITAVTLLADQSGSVVVDIWKDTYANYPPTVADTITASAKPTLSSATKSRDTTLTGWTTSISAGDTLRFNIDSVSTITRLALTLTVTV